MRSGTANHREAFTEYSEALRINENYPEAHCNLGRLLAQLGRKEEAQGHLRKALLLKPDYEDAKRQLGQLDRRN